MGMLDGVSQCWWLSKNCVVNWDAWAAIGTLAAVAVALLMSIYQTSRADRAQRSRARWVALELRRVLPSWRGRVVWAMQAGDSDLFFLLDDDPLRDPVKIPPDLTAVLPQLHELGDDAASIADAIWIARTLDAMPIHAALDGSITPQASAQKVIRQYRAGLRSLTACLRAAERIVERATGLSAADPDSHTFGSPDV
ncbi:hypothetical protein [Xanthomonas arboricola]|uniref:hypothetical protein n=1 Tax=Xanthomonas arboricola TaxID=56448 RepID=UPI000CEEB402|nr:hypothetical protein [Xanthomonas arboricola]PPU41205.1 hypothetical protein XaplCFBP3123_09055 [Xanthomonas arboricola pv. populi]